MGRIDQPSIIRSDLAVFSQSWLNKRSTLWTVLLRFVTQGSQCTVTFNNLPVNALQTAPVTRGPAGLQFLWIYWTFPSSELYTLCVWYQCQHHSLSFSTKASLMPRGFNERIIWIIDYSAGYFLHHWFIFWSINVTKTKMFKCDVVRFLVKSDQQFTAEIYSVFYSNMAWQGSTFIIFSLTWLCKCFRNWVVQRCPNTYCIIS